LYRNRRPHTDQGRPKTPDRTGRGEPEAPTREPEHRQEAGRWTRNPAARRQRGGRRAEALPGGEGRAATEAGAARRTAKADRKPGGTEAPDGAEPLPRPHRTAGRDYQRSGLHL